MRFSDQLGRLLAADPEAATRPSPLSFYAFAFLAVALGLLLYSMSRHLRAAQRNLDTSTAQQAAETETAEHP